ncbi:MAG: hypothetical protein PF518_16150 [Spirochaetaceae bacterium]|jgi:hypothetical protein|nr:hypothetical protein [Spirochaetaceae bacterium]
MKNPLFEEQIRVGFINFNMVRLHLVGLGVITVLVFLFYPEKDISYYLARSTKPDLFNIAFFSVSAFLTYLTIKTAIFSIEVAHVISIHDWFLYTKLKIGTYLWGRISYGIFYTFFILVMFLPLLLVAASVSSIGPYNILAIILVLYLFLLNLFMFGLLLYTFFKKQHWVLTLILWFSVILILLISPTFLPEYHPTLLVLNLQISTDILSDLYNPIIFLFLSLFFSTVLSWLSMFSYSRSLHER